jgi:nicotinate-nucleotide pyrophosphorylase (carboxylating)
MSGKGHGGLKPAAAQAVAEGRAVLGRDEQQIPRSARNDAVVRGAREKLVKRALFRGERLHMGDATYRVAVVELLETLLLSDLDAGDLTAEALALPEGRANAKVVAKDAGVVAGLEELRWLMERGGLAMRALKNDGDAIESGEAVAEIEGRRGDLLAYERTALNLLQRMSGIATMTRSLQDRVQRSSVHARHEGTAQTFLVATRKTPWGLLDKRAVHLGGGGTHRLSLSDAILIKNNHLALLSASEEQAVVTAIERAWAGRKSAAFVEVEVRGTESAVAACEAFRRVRGTDADACPCLLLLDNMSPGQVRETLNVLQSKGLRDEVVVEVSGAISESTLDEYASCGGDALSMGALTHSPRALDLSLKIS